MLTFVFVAGPRSSVDGVFVAGHWVGSGVLRHADATKPGSGEVLRHAGVGRVQAKAGSWRRWVVGVGGGGAGRAATSWSSSSVDVPVTMQRQVPTIPLR